MDRSNIDKIAHTPEDRMLLAKVWDKIQSGFHRDIPANSCFLSPRELEMTHYLFGNAPGLTEFGGYPDAERKMLVYLPDYLDDSYLMEECSPVVCLRASYFEEDTLSHRDFLGALMGAGIARETVGDICVGKEHCDFFVTQEIAPYILQNFTSAGRAKLSIQQIPLSDADIPEPEVKEIRDTMASLRLDSVISSGFRIRRSLAAQYVNTVAIGDINQIFSDVEFPLNRLKRIRHSAHMPCDALGNKDVKKIIFFDILFVENSLQPALYT